MTTTTFSSQLVGGDLVGQDVDVEVTVSQVQEQELPELDDDFAQLASEFDTVDELTADVRERLGRGKRLEQAAAARDAVLEALLEQVEIPLPDTLVADELNARRENIEQQLGLRRHHRWSSTSRTRARPSRSSRPTSSAVSATPSSRSASSTRSPSPESLRGRPGRALRAPGAARPAVGPGPAGVRQPHVRAQPHPRARAGDPTRQGARQGRRDRNGHRRVGQRGRAQARLLPDGTFAEPVDEDAADKDAAEAEASTED